MNALKRDLQDWRTTLDQQVKNYRTELGDLRKTLNAEIESLRTEFVDLRHNLRSQLEVRKEEMRRLSRSAVGVRSRDSADDGAA